jgi:ATP-dependent protease HslVU (ClpYQ) peptidase subunit
MSVIVAVKENGTIYMGADSQTTAGNRKMNHLNETSYKVVRLDK